MEASSLLADLTGPEGTMQAAGRVEEFRQPHSPAGVLGQARKLLLLLLFCFMDVRDLSNGRLQAVSSALPCSLVRETSLQ